MNQRVTYNVVHRMQQWLATHRLKAVSKHLLNSKATKQTNLRVTTLAASKATNTSARCSSCSTQNSQHNIMRKAVYYTLWSYIQSIEPIGLHAQKLKASQKIVLRIQSCLATCWAGPHDSEHHTNFNRSPSMVFDILLELIIYQPSPWKGRQEVLNTAPIPN